MKKYVVDTDLIKVIDTGAEYVPIVTAQSGELIECEPFKRNMEGLVAALLLAADVCAGKFYPRRVLRANIEGVNLVNFTKNVLGFDDDLTGGQR